MEAGGCFYIKMSSHQYWNSHYKDKMISQPSYLYVWNPHIWKEPLYRNGSQNIPEPGGCFTDVSRTLQNNLAKIYNARNSIYAENFKLKICTCAQSMALGMRTNFQCEIHIRGTISVIYKFRENILESL